MSLKKVKKTMPSWIFETGKENKDGSFYVLEILVSVPKKNHIKQSCQFHKVGRAERKSFKAIVDFIIT